MTRPLETWSEPGVMDWMSAAICSTSPDAHYPERGESPAYARHLCHQCPVIAECLAYALAHDERFGVWGGMTAEERREIKKG